MGRPDISYSQRKKTAGKDVFILNQSADFVCVFLLIIIPTKGNFALPLAVTMDEV